MSDYKAGTYVKGGETRFAGTPGEAVALAFDGYVFGGDQVAEDVSAADARAQAKSLGLSAKGSKEDVVKAVAKASAPKSSD